MCLFTKCMLLVRTLACRGWSLPDLPRVFVVCIHGIPTTQKGHHYSCTQSPTWFVPSLLAGNNPTEIEGEEAKLQANIGGVNE